MTVGFNLAVGRSDGNHQARQTGADWMDASRLGPVWTLWLQGWDAAPPVARASRTSWQVRNPDLEIRALDGTTWQDHVPHEDAARITRAPDPVVLSELLRLELLFHHGGVWADATTLCALPLADWLPERIAEGFVAFARPGPDRPLSTWFLAARPADPTIAAWRASAIAYWIDRDVPERYFWMHDRFAELLEQDPGVADRWARTAAPSSAPADHRFHFAPGAPRLAAPAMPEDLDALARGDLPPVLKLTHKGVDACGEGSLLDALLRFGVGP